MKSLFFVSVICGCLFCGGVQAQECQGSCKMPVRNAVAATANVVRGVVQLPVAAVQTTATVVREASQVPVAAVQATANVTRKVFHRGRNFTARIRGIIRGCN